MVRIIDSIIICFLCVSCVFTPENPSYYDTLYKRELEYCNQLLSVYFLFQDTLPDYIDRFASCESLFVSLKEPQTFYYTKSRARQIPRTVNTLTRESGTGITLATVNGLYMVTDVVPASPAALAGMQVYDTVQTINDTAALTFPQDRITGFLSGKAGLSVTFGIARQTGLDTIKVIYATFNDRSVSLSWIDSAVVYIGVKVFASQTCLPGGTAEEFAMALDSSHTAEYTIVDLRNTTGGDFDQSRTMAGYFVSGPGALVDKRARLYDQIARSGRTHDTTWTVSDSGPASMRRCYLLVNNLTSQAAEVFVAAVHYNRPDVLSVGTTTAGNARAQGYFETPDSGLAVITTTIYSPPGSPTFDGTGITPRYPILPGSNALDVVRSIIGVAKK